MAGIRTFVAVKLDDPLCQKLNPVVDSLRARMPTRSVRWVATDKIHLTLKFLGDIGPSQVAAIAEALSGPIRRAQPFHFELSGLGCFPNAGRPRVLWVGIQDPAHQLRRLYEAVDVALADLGFERERRAFSPHLTLGRVRNETRGSDLREVGQIITSTHPGVIGRQEVTAVRLFKSDLQPGGAVYTSLAEFPLGDPEE